MAEKWTPPSGVEAPAHAPAAGVKTLRLSPKIKNKTPLIGKAILKLDHCARDEGSGLWVYRNGCYAPNGERAVVQRLRGLTQEGDAEIFSRHRANEVAAWIEAGAPTLWERPPLDVVNVHNGLLDLESGQLLPHTPQHLSTVQIPVDFDPVARCPAWETFIGEVFPEDGAELAWELIGLMLVPDTSFKKAGLFLGDGDNGKSTFIELLICLLGRANVSTVSLHELESNRFAKVRLLGKLANLCADLPSAHLQETSTFLAVTGGDFISAERKYGASFDFRPFSRLIFSANLPPRSKDGTSAFFERWLTVPFTAVFKGARAVSREEIRERLTAPSELSGVLNRALRGLAALRERGRFREPKSLREAANEFRATTDPLAAWWGLTVTSGPGLHTPKRELHRLYCRDCERHGRHAPSDAAFAKRLLAMVPGLRDGKKTIMGKRVPCWLGIGIRSAYTNVDLQRAGVETGTESTGDGQSG